MTNPKRLSELCKECPIFDAKIKEVVLDGPFNSHDDKGKPYTKRDLFGEKWAKAFISGKIG